MAHAANLPRAPFYFCLPAAAGMPRSPLNFISQRYRGGEMTTAINYTGGCHCGLVRYECTGDLAMVTACNCSICTKKGLHFTFLPTESFQLRAGDDVLKEYLFNKHAIRHQLCIECGVDVFARGQKPDGAEVIALNVATIDQVNLSALKMTPIDGRNR
jgi:hypothetical protein